jgi:hypothetical protein
MVKEKVKENLGVCGICHLAVRHVDDYVKIEDYIKGKLQITGFYHRVCFRNKIHSSPEMKQFQDMAKNLMDRTNRLLSGAGA